VEGHLPCIFAREAFQLPVTAGEVAKQLEERHGLGDLQIQITAFVHQFLPNSISLTPLQTYRYLLREDECSEESEPEFDSASTQSMRETFAEQLYERDTSCLVTGLNAGCGPVRICDAHEIAEHEMDVLHSFDIRNGLWLSGHWRDTFERHQWTVFVVRDQHGVAGYQVHIMDPSIDAYYKEYDGCKLRLSSSPDHIRAWPSVACLDHHRREAQNKFRARSKCTTASDGPQSASQRRRREEADCGILSIHELRESAFALPLSPSSFVFGPQSSTEDNLARIHRLAAHPIQ
jgi:hypothetical protein